MTKTKKNKSILKRILAFLGAGVCALACMLTFGYNSNMTAYARDFDEYYSYSSIEHNVKISNSGSFSKNIIDINDFVSGDIVSNGTKYGDSDIYFRTNSFIPVISNSKYTLNYHGVNELLIVGVKTYLTNDMSTGSQYLNISTFPYTFIIPDNVKYIKLVIKPQDVNNLKNINIQLESGEVATNYVPYQQNDFISFTNTLNVGIEKNSSAWLLEQCVFNNLRTSNSDYYMKSSIDDGTLQNVIYYNSNNVKGNFMFKDFFKYKDNVIDENNYFRIFVNFDYIESSDYDSTTYFNGNVQKIIYGSHKNWETYKSLQVREKPSDWGTQYAKFNFISYVDYNGNNCNIYFPLISDNDNDYYGFRTLFVTDYKFVDYEDGYNAGVRDGKNQGYDLGKHEGYDIGYENGKIDGFDIGKSNGYNLGYDEGLTYGKNVGFDNGYRKGIDDKNDYTFLGLLSACIDAPITYFASLFNFELLGVNLSAFLTGLFTLCVIVTIVKLCLGGK